MATNVVTVKSVSAWREVSASDNFVVTGQVNLRRKNVPGSCYGIEKARDR